jgi:hypothetical protein
MKKHVVYARPEEGLEEFTRHLFSMYSMEIGFEIIKIQKRFPDCTAIDTRKGNKLVHIELEYEAGNFLYHGHDKQLCELPQGVDCIVVCWTDKGSSPIRKMGIEVISLKDVLNIVIAPIGLENIPPPEKPLYRIIGYNPKFASGKYFSDFENVKIFRTRIKFKNNHLPKGSIIILYEKGKLIGEFTIIKYIWIERPPKSGYEKELYRLLTYPVSMSADPLAPVENWVKVI